MSITPAFSPIPASSLPIGVSGASSLNRRRCTLDDLYEQCSDHITEYMASSDEVGRRPRISMILAYSSRFRPSAAHGWASPGLERAFATVSATRARLPADRRLRPDRPTPAHCVVRAEPGDRQRGVGGHGEPHTATTIVDQGAEDCSPEQCDQHRVDRAELLPHQGHRVAEDDTQHPMPMINAPIPSGPVRLWYAATALRLTTSSASPSMIRWMKLPRWLRRSGPRAQSSTEISPTATTADPAIISSLGQVMRTPDIAKASHRTAGLNAITPPKSLPMVGQPSQITIPRPMAATATTAAFR